MQEQGQARGPPLSPLLPRFLWQLHSARGQRNNQSDSPDVLGLKALGPLGNLELDLLALTQSLEPLHQDCGVVNEHVFAVLACDEAKPL